jgi:hypothetical protein
MNLAAAIERMEAAGMDPASILLAVKCIAPELSVSKVDEQAERRRAADRERKRLRNSAESAESAEVPSPLVPPLSPAPLSPPIIPPTQIRSSDDFDEFWEVYPRKVGKGTARKAFKSALLKTSFETLKAAARAFAAKCAGKDETFIPHAASWLNAERWQDADLVPKSTEPIAVAGRVYVTSGTDAMDAWDQFYRKTRGKSAPRDQRGGWYFETEYPQEQAA